MKPNLTLEGLTAVLAIVGATTALAACGDKADANAPANANSTEVSSGGAKPADGHCGADKSHAAGQASCSAAGAAKPAGTGGAASCSAGKGGAGSCSAGKGGAASCSAGKGGAASCSAKTAPMSTTTTTTTTTTPAPSGTTAKPPAGKPAGKAGAGSCGAGTCSAKK